MKIKKKIRPVTFMSMKRTTGSAAAAATTTTIIIRRLWRVNVKWASVKHLHNLCVCVGFLWSYPATGVRDGRWPRGSRQSPVAVSATTTVAARDRESPGNATGTGGGGRRQDQEGVRGWLDGRPLDAGGFPPSPPHPIQKRVPLCARNIMRYIYFSFSEYLPPPDYWFWYSVKAFSPEIYRCRPVSRAHRRRYARRTKTVSAASVSSRNPNSEHSPLLYIKLRVSDRLRRLLAVELYL